MSYSTRLNVCLISSNAVNSEERGGGNPNLSRRINEQDGGEGGIHSRTALFVSGVQICSLGCPDGAVLCFQRLSQPSFPQSPLFVVSGGSPSSSPTPSPSP